MYSELSPEESYVVQSDFGSVTHLEAQGQTQSTVMFASITCTTVCFWSLSAFLVTYLALIYKCLIGKNTKLCV